VKLSLKTIMRLGSAGLARHYPERAALRMEAVAEEQGVPPKYLPRF